MVEATCLTVENGLKYGRVLSLKYGGDIQVVVTSVMNWSEVSGVIKNREAEF